MASKKPLSIGSFVQDFPVTDHKWRVLIFKVSFNWREVFSLAYRADVCCKTLKGFLICVWCWVGPRVGKCPTPSGTPDALRQNYAAPQALIDGANIWMATWLYNIILSENLGSWILNPRSSKLETRPSCVETQSSHLETRSVWASRHEDRVSSFELQVSTYIWAVL